MIRWSFIFFIVLVPCNFHQTTGRSWIACTDYAKKNAAKYNHNLCRGYPRNGKEKTYKNGTFGHDLGFDHRPSESRPCQATRNDAQMYDKDHPIAVYYPGQQVVLAHPMKNHGSDRCTNGHIPDNGNFIYRGERDAASDTTLSGFRQNLVANLGIKPKTSNIAKYPKPGYQNAPAFCTDMDKSLGTYSFNVPKGLKPGRYTFIWLWAFNNNRDLYSTCFEVDIVESLKRRNSELRTRGFSNTYEPCGGMTSQESVMGNVNEQCTDDSGASPSTLPPVTTARPRFRTRRRTTPSSGTDGKDTVVSVDQMGGQIRLPLNDGATQRRIVDVTWLCSPTVSYWNAEVLDKETFGDGSVRHHLVQGADQLNVPMIYFTASFSNLCDLKVPPIAKVVNVE